MMLVAGGKSSEPTGAPKPRAARRSTRRPRGVSKRVLGYRAAQVYRFVVATIEQTGFAPSYGDICAELGIATKGEVSDIVQGLERRGLLMRVGQGRVRRGRMWNKPRIKLALTKAFPVPDDPLE